MHNIIAYVKNNNADFSQTPFNRVDALVLSWLSYCKYPECLKGEKAVALKDLPNEGLFPDNEMYADAFLRRKSKRLFELASKSARFGGIRLMDYAEEKDASEEKQFAAVCMEISDCEYFISFRGTDPSFVGVKEDLNLALMFPVPSQHLAKEYAERVMNKLGDGKFCFGGHSKGGNVAVYAATNLCEQMQDRILKIFNFDGPGFSWDIYSQQNYKRIENKIIKTVTDSTLVGVVLKTDDRFAVIKSRSFWFLQHDPFLWKVKDNDFKPRRNRTKQSVKAAEGFNKWVDEMTLPERERIIKIMYDALNTLETRDINEVYKTLYRQLPKLYKAYRKLDSDDRKFFNAKVKRLRDLLLNIRKSKKVE